MHAAFAIAAAAHGGKARKGTDIPYLSHLMAVSALVMEHGGTETQAAAALLHDAIEDTETTFESLSAEIGRDIAQIVRDCSDTEAEPGADKEDWKIRKERYLERLKAKDATDPSVLVALADKVHNGEYTADNVRHMSLPERKEFFGSRFTVGWALQEWWYSELVKAFQNKATDQVTQPLIERLRQVRNEIFAIDPMIGAM